MLNKVMIIGRVGKDPEVRETKNGTSVANLLIATTERHTNTNQEKVERTEWHKVVAWGTLACIVGQYVKKGQKVYVEGRIQTDSFVDKSGEKKYYTQIVAQSVLFLEKPTKTEAPEEEYAEESTPF